MSHSPTVTPGHPDTLAIWLSGQNGGTWHVPMSPRKWTHVPWKRIMLKVKLIFQPSICKRYVSFQGCNFWRRLPYFDWKRRKTFWQHVASGVSRSLALLHASLFSPSPPALGDGKPCNRKTDSKHQHISAISNKTWGSKFEVPKKQKGTNLELLFNFCIIQSLDTNYPQCCCAFTPSALLLRLAWEAPTLGHP